MKYGNAVCFRQACVTEAAATWAEASGALNLALAALQGCESPVDLVDRKSLRVKIVAYPFPLFALSLCQSAQRRRARWIVVCRRRGVRGVEKTCPEG